MSVDLESVSEQPRSLDRDPLVDSGRRCLSGVTGEQRLWARLLIDPCVLLYALNFVVRTALAATFPLLEEEARLWELSRFPAWGYTDQMPFAAWLLRLCSMPWETPGLFALRLPALILGSIWPLLVYMLALTLFENRRVARWSLIFSLCLPVLSCVGIATLPETPLVVFHLLLLLVFWKALQGEGSGYWVLAGVLLGLAFLSKLSAMLALASMGLYLGVSVEHRPWLRRRAPYLALGVAVLVISPWLVWNQAHDGATISYLVYARLPNGFDCSLGNLGEVCFEQLAQTTPFLFVPVFGCLFVTVSRLPDHRASAYLFVRVQSLAVLGFYFLTGAFIETHPHWTLIAYPSAVICLAALVGYQSNHWLARKIKFMTVAAATALFFVGLLVSSAFHRFPKLEKHSFGERWAGKLEQAEQELFGWREAEIQLSRCLATWAGEPRPLIFTCGHQEANLVSFHHDGPPVIDLAPLSLSPSPQTNLQREYIDYQALVGRGGVFFEDADVPCTELLHDCFQEAIELGPLQITHGDRVVKHLRVFRVRGLKPTAVASLSSR